MLVIEYPVLLRHTFSMHWVCMRRFFFFFSFYFLPAMHRWVLNRKLWRNVSTWYFRHLFCLKHLTDQSWNCAMPSDIYFKDWFFVLCVVLFCFVVVKYDHVQPRVGLISALLCAKGGCEFEADSFNVKVGTIRLGMTLSSALRYKWCYYKSVFHHKLKLQPKLSRNMYFSSVLISDLKEVIRLWFTPYDQSGRINPI